MIQYGSDSGVGQRFSVVPWVGGQWLLCCDGRLRARFRSESRARRVCGYMNGAVPPASDPIWDVVAAGVAADLARMEGGQGA
jgi:hypothetical protein